MSKHMSAKSIRAELGPADVDGSYTAQFNGTRFELYWDDQDPNNEGWWLRYIQPDGYEDGYAIDGVSTSPTGQMSRGASTRRWPRHPGCFCGARPRATRTGCPNLHGMALRL